MKKILKCTCKECDADFEMEADYLIPGVEGFMDLPEGRVRILDPTKVGRKCDSCTAAALEEFIKSCGRVSTDE